MTALASLAGAPIGWQPTTKQAFALRCPARELLFGGTKGAGKTEYLVTCWSQLLELAHKKFLETGQRQHKCRIIIFRKNLDHLKDWIAKSQYIYPLLDPEMGTGGWKSQAKTWEFTSGATIECRHLDGPGDHLGFHGQELIGIGFDQVEQIERHVYVFIVANCRSGDADYHAARIIRCTANPGGHDWIIPHFGIDSNPQGGRVLRIETTDEEGNKYESTRAFVRAGVTDNQHLKGDYVADLKSRYNDDEIAMYIHGDFFRVAGSFFSRFLRPEHHFVDSFQIPGDWEMSFGMDWGSDAPASLHVGALSPEGRLYVIDELHGPGGTGRLFGERMAKLWANQKWSAEKLWRPDDFFGVIDKQAMDRYGSEQTAAAGIMSHGFRLFEAQKDRLAGCNQLKERLRLDRNGKPQVVIFRDRCPELVKALSAIPSNAPEKPDEYNPKSPHSHACDSFRFLAMQFPVRDLPDVNPKDAEVDRWVRMLRKQKAERGGDGDMTTGYE